ncbi:conserved hypothetical protein [Candidatus Magnetomoraceae bacterium gMMP-15]
MKTMLYTIFYFLSLIISAYSFNSLVTPEDLAEMKKAGISQEIIQYLIENQTCSIGAYEIIKMKKSGLQDELIKSAIQTDLFNKIEKTTAASEAELIEKLKNAGVSDETILQFLQITRSEKYVDHKGRTNIRYIPQRRQVPVEGAVLEKTLKEEIKDSKNPLSIFFDDRNN